MFARKLFFLTLLSFVVTSAVSPIDLTPFYRAALFQGEAKRDVADWTTHVDFRYAEGSTGQSWNTQEVKTWLFDAYGPFDITKLGIQLETIDPATMPETKKYLEEGGTGENITGKTIGDVHFTGTFRVEELNLTLQQNFLYGLYMQLHLPFREIKLNNINFINTDTTRIEGYDSFINDHLDDILAENNILPYQTPINKTELSDPLISLGWHGHCNFSEGPVNALRGYLQAGILIPTGSRTKTNQVFSLPFGFNKHWGVHARGNAHATIWKKLVIGANAGVTIFLTQTYDQRLTTSTLQNGWISLEKGKVSVDQGTEWDVTAYLKAERLVGGLSAGGGYSYTQQEKTLLTLKDDRVLKTALANNKIKNKNEVINTNDRLSLWYQHVLHAYAQYDFKAHTTSKLAPKFEVAYHYPILGKHSWTTDMWSGTASLAFNWAF
ncbi:hypothetical protein KAT92_01310 [Candidatus Babeliales bacterium]|nr:hypothetical protein [Candidatus Babeliales bacterium]